MSKKHGFTYQQHVDFSKFIDELDSKMRPACKIIIEAFGWSSPPGKQCEALVLSSPKKATFNKLRFDMENNLYDIDKFDYLEVKSPYSEGVSRHSVTDTRGIRLPHNLTVGQHEETGEVLKKCNAEITHKTVLLINSYPRNNIAIKTLIGIQKRVDKLRDYLDDCYCREFRKTNPPRSPYY